MAQIIIMTSDLSSAFLASTQTSIQLKNCRLLIILVFLLSLTSARFAHGQSTFLLDSSGPYTAGHKSGTLFRSISIETGAIPAVANTTELRYGLLPSVDLLLGSCSAEYMPDEGFTLGSLSAVEARISWTQGQLVPHAGFVYRPGDPYWVVYAGDLGSVSAVLSPHGDPGWDVYGGLGFSQAIDWLGRVWTINGSAVYARTFARDHFPDSELYKNRIFINVAPAMYFRRLDGPELTVSVQNRFTLWLKRGLMLDVLPQFVFGPIGGSLSLVGGVSLPAFGGDVFRLVAGFKFRLPALPRPGRITVTDLFFPPNQAILFGRQNEHSDRNGRILRDLYRDLQGFPQHSIIIEGHTSFVHWDNRRRGRVEQREVLLPLSRARAQAVKEALVDMGIDPDRIQVRGRGARDPAVPFSNRDEQWKNRRVELILVPPRGGGP